MGKLIEAAVTEVTKAMLQKFPILVMMDIHEGDHLMKYGQFIWPIDKCKCFHMPNKKIKARPLNDGKGNWIVTSPCGTPPCAAYPNTGY